MRRATNALFYAAALAAGFFAFTLASPTPAHGDEDETQDVMTMDVDFLREKLLKIWNCEIK